MIIADLYKNTSINQMQVALITIGIVVACWIMYIQHGWINDDSVIYFETARLFSIGEWKLAAQQFPWPFYPLLIAAVHYFTSLDFQQSAQILNVALLALAIHSMLQIIILAGGDKLSLVLAALLFFSTTYIVGDVLPMLLRDQGFWAFLLSAIIFLIRFYRQHNIRDAFYWQLLALIALLFRTETITYIALLPLVLLFKPDIPISTKARNFFCAYMLYAVLAGLALIAASLHGSLDLQDLEHVKDTFMNMSKVHDFSTEIAAKAQTMATAVLGEPLADFAWLGLILTLTSIAVVKCMTVAGITPLILTVLNYNNIKRNMAHDVHRILSFVSLVAFINAIIIILQVNILSNRYVIFFGLILLIFATFSARILLKKWQLKQLTKIEIVIVILVTALVTIGSILNLRPKDAGYNYEQKAVSYIKAEQAKNYETSKVFYTSPRTRYYGGEAYIGRGYDHWDFTQQAINDGSIYQYDFLAINLNINDQSAEREKILAEKLPQYVLLKTFYGYKNKKRVLVYKKVD